MLGGEHAKHERKRGDFVGKEIGNLPVWEV